MVFFVIFDHKGDKVAFTYLIIRQILAGFPCMFCPFLAHSEKMDQKRGGTPKAPLQRGMQLPPGENRPPARFWYGSLACALRASHDFQ